MICTITSTTRPATDLGFLLHKNPARVHQASLSFGEAHVFYPEAAEDRCTAALLLSINPVELVRGGGRTLEEYVNDRPYVSSSFTSVAISRIFGTALAGRCEKRPDLIDRRLPLEASITVVRVRGGEVFLRSLFEPLGYRVDLQALPLDERFPEWGGSPYFRVALAADVTVHDLLSHIYVLLPVLDPGKHYYIGEAEVEKLLRHGHGWLSTHPARDAIVNRYLMRRPSLTRAAFEQLNAEEGRTAEEDHTAAAEGERTIERPLSLNTQRLHAVAEALKSRGAKRVLDLGCGEGKLVRRLLADRYFEEIAAMDVSHRALEIATDRLKLDRLPPRQQSRVRFFQGSLLYRDERLAGYDGAAVVEVIEHLDSPRLAAFERAVFEFAKPSAVVVTTPNREYNVNFSTLASDQLRHADHRFEWTRAEFASWASRVAMAHRYRVTFEPVGPVDEATGSPTQMAIFEADPT